MMKKIVRRSLKGAGATILSLALLSSTILAVPQSANAQTTTTQQSISTLFSQIETALKATATSTQDISSITSAFAQLTQLYNLYLNNLSAAVGTGGAGGTTGITASPTAVSNASICGYLNGISRDLRQGTSDQQVLSLQKALNAIAVLDKSYQPVAYLGAGSRGQETSYFGPGTKAALLAWQRQNLEAGDVTGVTDYDTRLEMKEIYCAGSSSTTSTTSTGTSSSSSSVSKQIRGVNGPSLSLDGRVYWFVTSTPLTHPDLRIGTQSAATCENVSTHFVRDGKAYLPREDRKNVGSLIEDTFSYDAATLGEDTRYYYCFTGSDVASTGVSSFTVAELRAQAASSAAASAAAAVKVTITSIKPSSTVTPGTVVTITGTSQNVARVRATYQENKSTAPGGVSYPDCDVSVGSGGTWVCVIKPIRDSVVNVRLYGYDSGGQQVYPGSVYTTGTDITVSSTAVSTAKKTISVTASPSIVQSNGGSTTISANLSGLTGCYVQYISAMGPTVSDSVISKETIPDGTGAYSFTYTPPDFSNAWNKSTQPTVYNKPGVYIFCNEGSGVAVVTVN